jgi:hypothetical protein
MHEIVSFSKEIEFKSMINKITAISLEHTLMLEGKLNIKGDFIVSGSYKMTAASQLENDFSYKIPVDIEIDEKYDLSNLVIDIDDFTYEVIDDEILKVNIDLLLDKLSLIEKNAVETLDDEIVDSNNLFLEYDDKQELNVVNDEIEILSIDDEIKRDDKQELPSEEVFDKDKSSVDNVSNSDNGSSIFSSFDSSNETYSTYRVYIIRNGDNIDDILTKYKVTRDILEEYNNLDELRIGTKLIIPFLKNE